MTLKIIKPSKVGAKAQPTEARPNPNNETTATDLRPNRSAKGPHSKVVMAKAPRYAPIEEESISRETP